MASRTVIWWNVERLLAAGGSQLGRSLGVTRAQGWTREAYARKIDALAGVLRLAAPDRPPALLCLAEVENSAVAADLRSAVGWDSLEIADDRGTQLSGDDLVVLTLLRSKR